MAVGHVGYWNAYAWQFMLVYFHGATPGADCSVTWNHIRFMPRFHYDWVDAVKSQTPTVLDRSFGRLDYIYLLEPDALPKFEKVGWSDATTPFIRRFEAAVRQRYSFAAISTPIALSAFQQFRLYRLTPR